jgi:16S rRNA (cytidine1402-2'-O)-methyltransferase
MNSSPSFSTGQLFIVATPIGNLEDITLRALEVLREVDLIACEDTRRTLKLLNHFQIKKPLISYFHPREKQKVPLLLQKLKEGQKIALVSDAGTPGLSDPGFPLIKQALKAGIKITPIPGPSAITAALAAAGLPSHRFLFLGFPPPKKEATRKLLQEVADEPGTLVFFLPARRLAKFLTQLAETLGDREMVIAREITKVHEEFIRGQIKQILAKVEKITLKGEMTLLISGRKK